MVALLQRLHAGADVDDDAGALVAEDHREQALGIGAGARELVGVADAGGLDLDQHLAGPRAVEVHRLDDEGLAGLVATAARVFMGDAPIGRRDDGGA